MTDAVNEKEKEVKHQEQESPREREGLISYFRGVRQEMKKVVWPTNEELVSYTVIVFVACAFFALAFWGIDSGFLAILKSLLGITLAS